MLPVKLLLYLANGFRGEDFFYKLTNQKKELSVVAMFVNRLGQNEQCEKDDGHLVMAKAHITIFVKMLLID